MKSYILLSYQISGFLKKICTLVLHILKLFLSLQKINPMQTRSLILLIQRISLVFFIILSFKISAQSPFSGLILDERSKPIQNVGIYRIDSTFLTITNQNGVFNLKNVKTGDTIYTRHLSYKSVMHVIDTLDFSKKIVLKMEFDEKSLPEVEIYAGKPHVAYSNKVMSVIDYEINDKGIYLIAKKRRGTSLLHLNFTFDTLTDMKISDDYYNIYKDVYGEMQLVSNADVWQIGHKKYKDRTFEMELMYRTSLENFLQLFRGIVCATDSILVGGKYFFFGQEIYYYYFNIGGDQQAHEFHHCVNEENRDLMINLLNPRFGTFYKSGGYLDPRPTYDPCFAFDNKLYLFSFDEDKLFIYNNKMEVIHECPLTFHKYKNWNGKMKMIKKWDTKVILDWATGKFYTTFTDGGVTTIKRCNLEEGTADVVAVLGGFPFIESLRIFNGKAYFLFKNDNTKYNRLFSVAIE